MKLSTPNSQPPTPPLDDVARTPPAPNLQLELSDVGLENVQSQVRFQSQFLPAKANASVSLIDKHARGIHMSRLFKILSRIHEQDLTWPWLNACLDQMLASHQNLSDAGTLSVNFDLPVLRKALLTEETGWRHYPVSFRVADVKGKRTMSLTLRVLYSSTCPCSTGLSRQAIQEKFLADFRETETTSAAVAEWLGRASSLVAVPHSQRSEAICQFDFTQDSPPVVSLIDAIEDALGTPVQAAVKRADEQEFAKRNAANLMFCEDAARKLKAAFNQRSEIADFNIEVRHFESLHPHDVVARVQKF